jgi:copper transport protein
VALALVAVAGLAAPAGAHATLVGSDPAPGAVLGIAPAAVVLRFSEDVQLPTGALRLVDGRGGARPLAAAHDPASASVVRAALPGGLGQGGYAVTWRVVSADGHPVDGTVAFSIGDAALPAPASPEATEAVRVASWLDRAVGFAALLVLVGVVALALAEPDVLGVRAVRRLVVGAVVAGVVAALAGMGLLAAEVVGGDLGDAVDLDAWRALAHLGVGQWAQGRLVAWAVVGVAASVVGSAGRAAAGALGAALAVEVTTVVGSGHAGTGRARVLGIVTDVVHLAAAGTWLGGLTVVAVLLVLRHPAAARAAARFSAIAAVALGLAAVNGVVQAVREGVGLDVLATAFGTTLLAKVLVVVAVVGVAAVSRARLHRWRDERPHAGPAALVRPVALELGLAAVVVGLTAALVHLPPPRDEGGVAAAEATAQAQVAGLTATVVVRPATVGPVTVELDLADGDARPAAVAHVDAVLHHRDLGTAPLPVPLAAVSAGRYRSSAAQLPFAGRWTVDVRVSRGELDVATAQLAFTVAR